MSGINEKHGGEVLQTNEKPSEEMQHCLEEVVAILRKYEVGVSLCLANDRESVLLYRLPEWCAVSLSDNGPEVNSDQLWQTDNLEELLSRSYRLAGGLSQVNARLHAESERIEDFIRDLGHHLLDPDRKSH
ncbi:MAG: hypothetical protein CSA09_02270 [Candidatus Contendobacter odensis]|uniref:Uncharacterized protein n=1 Tax=Candidatus Contendibacter odensensis TaxID=1400860 RepID=A0A2G6PFJ4_9GAMM|nr:MAG: hypothetical protein CSA09_02270 [Candidatus Contendobacter odensis]